MAACEQIDMLPKDERNHFVAASLMLEAQPAEMHAKAFA